MFSVCKKITAIFATALFAVGCTFFSPDRDTLKKLPVPDSFCSEQQERNLVSVDAERWQKWLDDFSGRNFSQSVVSYAPGNAVIYGNGYSINFHEKLLILNFGGTQFTCERVPADLEFLIFLENQSHSGVNPIFHPIY